MTAMSHPASVKVQVLNDSPIGTQCDCLVLFIASGNQLCETVQAVDKQSDQWISQAIAEELLTTSFGRSGVDTQACAVGAQGQVGSVRRRGEPQRIDARQSFRPRRDDRTPFSR